MGCGRAGEGPTRLGVRQWEARRASDTTKKPGKGAFFQGKLSAVCVHGQEQEERQGGLCQAVMQAAEAGAPREVGRLAQAGWLTHPVRAPPPSWSLPLHPHRPRRSCAPAGGQYSFQRWLGFHLASPRRPCTGRVIVSRAILCMLRWLAGLAGGDTKHNRSGRPAWQLP